MSIQNISVEKPQKKSILSLDTWAVILSLALALFIRLGLIKSVAW